MNKLLPFRSVLIFGGAGFIGSNLAYRLLSSTNARVHIFDNLSRRGVHNNLRWLQQASGESGRLRVTIGDVRDAALVKRAVQSAAEIYHFAAQVAVTTSLKDPRTDFEVNVGGTFNILEAARASGHRPFLLFTSTNKVYGELQSYDLVQEGSRYVCQKTGINESEPLDFYSPYGCSKGAADQYVHDYSRMYGLPAVVFRMSCIAGARQFGNEDQGWLAHFLYSAMKGQPLTIYGNGLQVRDVLCVDDLVDAFIRAHIHKNVTAGNIYNIGGGPGNSISLLELMQQIEECTGKGINFTCKAARPGDQLFYVTDFSKFAKSTGWRPQFGVRDILEKVLVWWKENRELLDPVPIPAAIPKSLRSTAEAIV